MTGQNPRILPGAWAGVVTDSDETAFSRFIQMEKLA